MQKTNLLKNSLISGTLILTFTGILSRIIGFFYRIFLSRTIGAEGLGIFQLIFPVFALLIAVSAAGIQTAVSRYCAQCENDRAARGYLYAGLFMSLILSVSCMLLVHQNAAFIGLHILAEERCVPLLRIMSWSLPFACIHACINGYYYGKKKTVIPSVSQLLEQIVRVGGVYLIAQICLEQHHAVTATAAVWGLFIGEFASALYSITMVQLSRHQEKRRLFHKKHTSDTKKRIPRTWRRIIRNLLGLSVPLTVNRILLSVFQSTEALLIPIQLRTFGYSNADALSVYGILTGMVFSTIMFPAVLSNSLSVMLLPAVSKACAIKRNDLVRKAVRQTVESCTVLGLICTFFFLLAGNWIGTHLFHNTLAGVYIETLSWICPFIFLSSTLTSILQGLGKATATLLINLSGAVIRIGFVYLGIPVIGLKAYLWGMLVSQIWTALLAYLCIRKFAVRKNCS